MIQICRIVFVIMCAMAAVGCTSRIAERQLTQAESLMDQSPDSALTLLNAIDSRPLKGELRARHALLLSQAYDKNYIDVADDSLINIAFDYYRNTDDDRRLMQAAYYKSVVIHNAKNYLQSLRYAAMADTLANRLGEYKFAGLAASIMFYNSGLLQSNQAEIDYAYKARKMFLLANDSTNAMLASFHLANALLTARLFDEAAKIIETIDNPKYSSSVSAWYYCFTRDDNKLDSVLKVNPSLNEDSWLCSQRARNIIETGGDLDQARLLLNHAERMIKVGSDITAYNWVSARLAKAEKRYEDYIKYEELYERELEESNTFYQLTMVPQSYTDGLNYIHERDMNALNKKRESVRNTLYVSLFIIFIFCLITVILFQNKARKKAIFEKQIYALQAEYGRLYEKYENASFERESLNCKVEALQNSIKTNSEDTMLSARLELLIILSELYKNANTDVEQDRITGQIRMLVKELSGKKLLKLLEQSINRHYDNLIARIRDLKILRDIDLDILIYFYAGFSVNIISIITNQTSNYISVHRFRIRERLQNAGFDEEFQAKLLNIFKKLEP